MSSPVEMPHTQRRMPFEGPADDRPQNLATPPDLYRHIQHTTAHGAFFDLDAAAELWSCKAPAFFSDRAPCHLVHLEPQAVELGCAFDRDAWAMPRAPRPPVVFCNPPFNAIHRFMSRAILEVERRYVSQVVFLVPARMGRDWWVELVPRAAYVRPLRGRVDFVYPPGTDGKKPGGFEDCAVVVFESSLVAKP